MEKKLNPTLFKEQAESETLSLDETDERKQRIVACRRCNRKIAYTDDKINYDGQHLYTFANPSGILFEIGLYSEAEGCILEGPYSDDFSWFKDYSWRVALCSGCYGHMGWHFQSSAGSFFGIITEMIFEGENG